MSIICSADISSLSNYNIELSFSFEGVEWWLNWGLCLYQLYSYSPTVSVFLVGSISLKALLSVSNYEGTLMVQTKQFNYEDEDINFE